MTERWNKCLLGKGFRFDPVGHGKLSGSDLIGYALLKVFHCSTKSNLSWERGGALGRKTTER